MPELGSYGSVRGARGNSRPYREPRGYDRRLRHLPSHRESFNSHRPIEDRRRRLDGQRTKTAELAGDPRVGRGRYFRNLQSFGFHRPIEADQLEVVGI